MSETPDDLELSAYLDGELDPLRALAFERRLAAEPALARRHRSLLTLRDGLRAAVATDRPSAALEARLRGFATPPRGARLSGWPALAASLILGLGLGVAGAALVGTGSPLSVDDYLVAGHIRALLATQPIDIASSDRHAVKPWFARKVALSPDVPDLSPDGFELVGGRIDVLGREPVATTVYRHSQHIVSLAAFPVAQAPPQEIEIAGYRTRRWRQGDLAYVAVSDLPGSDLAAFERSFRAATSGWH